jgi:hypothetical protein
VRSKASKGAILGHIHAASNEGSPAAIKLHGKGPRDRFHFEIDGEPG